MAVSADSGSDCGDAGSTSPTMTSGDDPGSAPSPLGDPLPRRRCRAGLAYLGIPVVLIGHYPRCGVLQPFERLLDLVADLPTLNDTGLNHARDEINGIVAACKLVFPDYCRNG